MEFVKKVKTERSYATSSTTGNTDDKGIGKHLLASLTQQGR